MTRINCIPVETLADQHLLAEYNEMAMALASLRRSKATGRPLPSRSEYTLGSGHVIFFYDKGKYLRRRYSELVAELTNRGYNLDPDRKMEWEVISKELDNDWIPDRKSQEINLERIRQRISLKPHWYTFHRQKVPEGFWQKYYANQQKIS